MGVTSFKNLNNIGEKVLEQELKDNISQYIDWAFLEAGAYFNIRIPTSGSYGGNREKLVRIDDPRFTAGKVWEAARKNFIWESGISHQSTQPIAISGLFINTTFFPINSGYYIDYPNGRVVFDRPLPANSSVKLEYSHKWISVVSAENIDVLQVQPYSFRSDDSKFLSNSGVWNILSDTRLQLPAICIENPILRKNNGFDLGHSTQKTYDIPIHILAEDDTTAIKLAGILTNQKEQALFFFDSNRLISDNKLPVNYRGQPRTNALTYPMLIEPSGNGGYRSEDVRNGQVWISDTDDQGGKELNKNTFHHPITWTIEAILP